jgi:large subunit ribosomal protein L10
VIRVSAPCASRAGGIVVSGTGRRASTTAGARNPPEEPVPRPDKVAAVDEVKSGLTGSAATLLTHYRGLSVTELAELRAKLREVGAEYRVAKNTLTRIAARDAGMAELQDLLEGPTALVFCSEDPVAPAKALKAFAKDHPALVVRGGYLDGEVLDEAAAIKLADLASKEELLAQLAGLMYGALANTARLLQAPIEKQARLVQALIDAGGNPDVAETPAAEEPAAEAAAAEEPAAEEAPAEEAPAEEPAAEEPAAEEPAAEDAPAAGDEPTSDA